MSCGNHLNADGIDEQHEAFMADDPESYTYLTQKQVSEMTGLAMSTIDTMKREGRIGYSKFGGKVMFKVSDIRKLETRKEVN